MKKISVLILILGCLIPLIAVQSEETLSSEPKNVEIIPVSAAISTSPEDIAALVDAVSLLIESSGYLGEDRAKAEKLYKAYTDLLINYASFVDKGLSTKTETINSTNEHSKAMSYVVIAILIVGFAAALAEFFHAFKLRNKANRQVNEHTIEIGLQNLAIKSTLTGLVLFVVSIALYMIYVVYVLPIQVV